MDSIDSIESVVSAIDDIVTHLYTIEIPFYNWSHGINAGLYVTLLVQADLLNERSMPGMYIETSADLSVNNLAVS